MSQPRKLDKKLCLDKSKQKSFVLKGKRKSSSMQSFTEKVGFNAGGKWYLLLVFFACDAGVKDWMFKLSLYGQCFSVAVFICIYQEWKLNLQQRSSTTAWSWERGREHKSCNPRVKLSMRTQVFLQLLFSSYPAELLLWSQCLGEWVTKRDSGAGRWGMYIFFFLKFIYWWEP